MVQGIRKISEALGDGVKKASPSEIKNINIARNFIDLKRGLMRGLQTRIGKSGKLFAKGRKQTLETEVLENQPEGIIKAILGPAFTVKDAESFESLFKILDHPKYLYRDKKKEIIKTFVTVISISKGLVVPDEMEKYV